MFKFLQKVSDKKCLGLFEREISACTLKLTQCLSQNSDVDKVNKAFGPFTNFPRLH